MLRLQNQNVYVQMMVLRKDCFTDAELVETLAQEDKSDSAIRFLYREHFEFLSRYVTNNSGSEQDAEDIFQEVIIGGPGSERKNRHGSSFLAAAVLGAFRQ